MVRDSLSWAVKLEQSKQSRVVNIFLYLCSPRQPTAYKNLDKLAPTSFIQRYVDAFVQLAYRWFCISSHTKWLVLQSGTLKASFYLEPLWGVYAVLSGVQGFMNTPFFPWQVLLHTSYSLATISLHSQNVHAVRHKVQTPPPLIFAKSTSRRQVESLKN